MKKKESQPAYASHLLFPISAVCCPHCKETSHLTSEQLGDFISCPTCKREFIFIDAFLNHFRGHTSIFIDPIHAIPIAPGHTVGGEIHVIPDEMQVVNFGVGYNRPPELFFFDGKGHPVRDLLLENMYVAAVSISSESYILLSRTFDAALYTPIQKIKWMCVGEIGEREKPIWINILQNAADLILKSEDRAALVMLLIAYDFYIDAILEQLHLSERNVKAASRKWKISDRRTKIRLIEERLGNFPQKITKEMVELAEQRNRIVHGKVMKSSVRALDIAQAFQIVCDAIIKINDMKYTYFRRAEKNKQKK